MARLVPSSTYQPEAETVSIPPTSDIPPEILSTVADIALETGGLNVSSPVSSSLDSPSPPALPISDSYDLSHREFRILSVLLTREFDEPLISIAKRAKVSLAAVTAALRNPIFQSALHHEVDNESISHRAVATAALTRMATDPNNPDHFQANKFFHTRLDGFQVNINVSSNQSDRFPWHVLSIETRRKVLEELEIAASNGKTDPGFVGGLMLADGEGESATNQIIDV